MTVNRPITLQEVALKYGTFMGLYWIFKFSFIPMGFHVPFLHLLFVGMTLFVPVLAYMYGKAYRQKYHGGTLSFPEGFLFTFLLYMAAIMLSFLAHYLYFRFLDGGFLTDAYQQQLSEAKDMAQGEMIGLIDQSMNVFEEVAGWTSSQKAFWLAWQNLFYCVPLSLVNALLLRRKPRTNQ